MASQYPQNPDQWRAALEAGLGLPESMARTHLRAGTFPYDRLELWLQAAYTDGTSPAFVPALLRNIKGLVAWVYDDGEEPSWPGADPAV